MVLIAIDKHSRKILGYLCKNDQTVTYCCSECDEEFFEAFYLEQHMITHEHKSNNGEIQQAPQIPHADDDKTDETPREIPEPEPEQEQEQVQEPEPEPEPEPKEAASEVGVEVVTPPKPMSSIERENLLKIKYQVIMIRFFCIRFFFCFETIFRE